MPGILEDAPPSCPLCNQGVTDAKAQDRVATFKERFPAAALDALGSPDAGPKMDKAFSDPNSQYKLGNALRAKVGR